MIPIKMPFWLRVVSLIGVVVLVTGAGLFGYRYYTRPVTRRALVTGSEKAIYSRKISRALT